MRNGYRYLSFTDKILDITVTSKPEGERAIWEWCMLSKEYTAYMVLPDEQPEGRLLLCFFLAVRGIPFYHARLTAAANLAFDGKKRRLLAVTAYSGFGGMFGDFIVEVLYSGNTEWCDGRLILGYRMTDLDSIELLSARVEGDPNFVLGKRVSTSRIEGIMSGNQAMLALSDIRVVGSRVEGKPSLGVDAKCLLSPTEIRQVKRQLLL